MNRGRAWEASAWKDGAGGGVADGETVMALRYIVLGLSAIALSACAGSGGSMTSSLPAPMGTMWGYLTEVEDTGGMAPPRGFTYSANSENCAFGRANQISPPLLGGKRTLLGKCRLFFVGKGSDYWIFVLAPYYSFHGWGKFLAVGVNDRELCPKIREAVIQRYRDAVGLGMFGECQPIGLTPVP